MHKAINRVFKFVTENTGYQASIGIITSGQAAGKVLAWGAVHPENGDVWVPELDTILRSWPDASWTPITQQQASLFDEAYRREQTPRQQWLLSL